MRAHFLRTGAVLVGIWGLLFLGTGTSFAATPGADCGFGATIVGDDQAGKVTLGQDTTSTCTLTFLEPWPNGAVCTAVNETNTSRGPTPVGARSSKTAVAINTSQIDDGQVIAYICIGY